MCLSFSIKYEYIAPHSKVLVAVFCTVRCTFLGFMRKEHFYFDCFKQFAQTLLRHRHSHTLTAEIKLHLAINNPVSACKCIYNTFIHNLHVCTNVTCILLYM